MMKEYDSDMVHRSGFEDFKVTQKVEVILQDDIFKGVFTEEFKGNFTGLDLLEATLDRIIDNSDDGLIKFDTHDIWADDVDDLKKYVVKFEILEVEVEE